MDLFKLFFLTSMVVFTSGSPVASRSLNWNLISCPKDSALLDQFRAASPCSVFCLVDEDCGASGLACCSTNCGTRCVAESILMRTIDDDNEEDEIDEESEDEDDNFIDKHYPPNGSLLDKRLSILKDKLNEKRKEAEDSEEEDDVNDEVEEEQSVINEQEGSIGEVISTISTYTSPSSQTSSTSQNLSASQSSSSSPTEETSTTMTDEDEDDDGDDDDDDVEDDDDDDNDDSDDDGLESDYSYDEDLEMLLMKLLITLKSKQNAKEFNWKDALHSSKSLLEESPDKPIKNDFAVIAMSPAEALQETSMAEETRAIDAGRRSSMEKREPAYELEQEDSPNLSKDIINQSNAMR